MKKLVVILVALTMAGCGSAHLDARKELNRQYAELEQVQDLGNRNQKFLELQQRENVLIAEQHAKKARAAAYWQGQMIYQGLTAPRVVRIIH